MKKIILIAFLLLLPSLANAQRYDAIRQYVTTVPKENQKSVHSLARYLARPCETDEQKAMVAFAWIALNIEYDGYKYENLRNKKLPKIGNVWETRVGICGDIAELYQDILKSMGIKSEVVVGYAGRGMDRYSYKSNGHAWNVVYADGKKIIVDPTWGIEGTIGENYRTNLEYKIKSARRKKDKRAEKEKFKRNIDYSWFNKVPKEMIKTHYPEEKKWQLLNSSFSLNKFLYQNSLLNNSRF